MGAILLALVGAVLLIVPGSPVHKKTTLGLDLQGGLEVVEKAVPPKRHPLSSGQLSAALDRSVSIIRDRIDKLGVSEPDVRKQPPDQIVIELAGVHDPNRALAIIGKTAQLELYDLETSVTGPSAGAQQGQVVPETSLWNLLAGRQNRAKKGSPSAVYLFSAKTHRLIVGPQDTRARLFQDARSGGKKLPAKTKV